MDGAIGALQAEAARIFAESEGKRMNGGASGHIVLTNGKVSGYVKDAATLVQFAGRCSRGDDARVTRLAGSAKTSPANSQPPTRATTPMM